MNYVTFLMDTANRGGRGAPVARRQLKMLSVAERVKQILTTMPELRRKPHIHPLGEHCYVASEALWHALGGAESGLTPAYVKHEGSTHWFLRNDSIILDPTEAQFQSVPPYELAQGCGFLTRSPSKRAQRVLDQIR